MLATTSTWEIFSCCYSPLISLISYPPVFLFVLVCFLGGCGGDVCQVLRLSFLLAVVPWPCVGILYSYPALLSTLASRACSSSTVSPLSSP